MDYSGVAVAAHFVPVDDGSLPGTEEDQRQLLLEWNDFALDRYYGFLQGLTFPTKFVPVLDPARLLRVLSATTPLTAGDSSWKEQLVRELDLQIAALGGSCFVKLMRSPKDAVDKPVALGHAEECLRIELRALVQRTEFPVAEDLHIALKVAFFKALCVGDGQRCLDLCGSSNRVVSDLIRCKRLIGRAQDLSIALRKFVSIPLHSEMRCVVHERQLTCITQYFTELFFEELQGDQDALIEELRAFVTRVVLLLPPRYSSFILDVARPAGSDALCVVELNPFGRLTGAGLFDFDKDNAILCGRAPFEMRVRRERPNLCLSGPWKEKIDAFLVELGAGAEIQREFEESATVL